MPANRRRITLGAIAFWLGVSCAAESPPPGLDPAPVPAWEAGSSAVLKELVMGDVACYLSLERDGEPFDARGTFEACERQDLLDTTVQWSYVQTSVLADSCFGDPECTASEQAFLIDDLKPGDEQPFFQGIVGHLDKAVPFLTFADHHTGHIARLDLSWDGEVMVEHPEEEPPFFVLWTDCDPPETPGEALGAHRCGGVEIQLGEGAYELDDHHLNGTFQLGELVGPHQGLFALRLEPTSAAPAIDYAWHFGIEAVPSGDPVEFKPELVETDTLHHAGVFSPDLKTYFYTVSDQSFRRFDVKLVERLEDGWSEPRDAFFNSEHNEHGVAFSPDGRRLYFSSTRPVPGMDLPDTWRLWASELGPDGWSEPTFVDIPGMRHRLVSHPSLAADGTLYFHSGEPDYTDLRLFRAEVAGDVIQNAVALPPEINGPGLHVTPYVAPDESFLIFERVPDLWISRRGADGSWQEAVLLPKSINSDGKGNPYLTPDRRFLFFAAGPDPEPEKNVRWSIYWVDAASFLQIDGKRTTGEEGHQVR